MASPEGLLAAAAPERKPAANNAAPIVRAEPLSAVLAQDARDAGIPLRHQMLIQPCVSAKTFWWSSARENGDGPLLTTRMMMWFWREYLSTPEDSLNPRACPLEAKSLAGTEVAPSDCHHGRA